MKRRRFLSNLWKTGAAFIAGAGAWTTWDLINPLPSTGFGGVIRAVKPEVVTEGGVVEVATARSYLVRVDDEVIALSQKCTHLGCRVPFCESSGQFECPCHGSVFNRGGDHVKGAAPRGMDFFAVEIGDDGLVYIDTGHSIDGNPPGTSTVDAPPIGPRCTEEAH
ncbi:MAG: Rieske 2Fe-2S domain-containing protein [Actinomycetia bacterium]|nr:Rieske 2Fe-2S domain-containing protein [Actinomycetes bacterium]